MNLPILVFLLWVSFFFLVSLLPKETSLTDLAHYTFSREGGRERESVGRSVGWGNTFIPCIICLHLQTDQAVQMWGIKGEDSWRRLRDMSLS